MQPNINQPRIVLDKLNRILKLCIDCERWLPAFPHVFPVVDNQLEPTCWSCEERKQMQRDTQRSKRQHDAKLITML